MENQLITFETAKLAKEKGFDEECTTYYSPLKKWQLESNYWKQYIVNEEGFAPKICNNSFPCIYGKEKKYHNSKWVNKNITAPTQSLLQKWLREVHMIRVYLIHGTSGSFNFEIYIWDKPNNIGKWSRIGNISSLKTYEEALEKGLFQALKLI